VLSLNDMKASSSVRDAAKATFERPIAGRERVVRGLRLAGLVAVVLWSAAVEVGCATNAASSASCSTGDSAYLDGSQLSGGYQTIVDQRFTESPLAAHRLPVGTPPAQISEWLSGRLKGWISTIAVSGPDRPTEDETARSLGYDIGKWPLVPLSGPVVQHNPGILEIYETHDAFSAIEGAQAFFQALEQSALFSEKVSVIEPGGTKPSAAPLAVSAGDSSLGYETPSWTSSTAGMNEQYLFFVVRIGAVVVQLTVQGGAATQPRAGLALLNQALSRLGTSCRAA
jgi:hypothetical protein